MMHDDEMTRRIAPLIPALRRYARALMKNPAMADDLVQDCLERAVSRWHQHRSDGNTRTWMFTILHNLAVNSWQQARFRGVHVMIDDVGDAAFSHPPQQDENLHLQDVMAALEQLPDDQRSVVLLVSVEDLSYADTAKVLGVPVGTVMSRLSRGRERLHQILAGATNGTIEKPHGPALRRVK
ncbi:sigma-70 family RNA polymerase sigma factor [uncultured Thalassospira sp.]|uniref:sigma-70 family RNA polymerase sigma factor n=1 Tax=uncultured Thalassospira sp. TaxID=404382 RepID=UPI0030DC7457|tara:strand:+ start:132 stop:677 length:546 start_codon:yes stop_codon:yes gene_type:complete